MKRISIKKMEINNNHLNKDKYIHHKAHIELKKIEINKIPQMIFLIIKKFHKIKIIFKVILNLIVMKMKNNYLKMRRNIKIMKYKMQS